MGFNLAEAAGFAGMMSNLDTREIEMIPVRLIDANENNFFTVEDVQDLKESIEVNGILQPLNVVKNGSRYRIIAGHRRFKAASELDLEEVPAIVLPEMSEAMEQLALIQTNTTARELSYPEKMEAARQLKKILLQLKEEGVELPGKLRDIMAEQLEISRTELARMNVIEKNLIPEGKQLLKEGKMSASAAYAMARTTPECQKELIDQKLPAYIAEGIEDYSVERTLDWITEDCPHPEGWWQHNEKSMGRKLKCPSWKKVKAHKDKGHPERCLGCCSACPNLPTCKDACDNAKHALVAKNNAHALELEKQERAAAEEREKEEFKCTPFATMGTVLQPLFEEGNLDMDEVAEFWNDNLLEFLPDHDDNSAFDAGHVEKMVYPETIDDIDWPLPVFVAFCDAVDQTPNVLLGYEDEDAAGWHLYAEKKPRLNQRVIVRRSVNGVVQCGEYIYRDGRWFNSGLDDFEMCLTGVTHWIEVPE